MINDIDGLGKDLIQFMVGTGMTVLALAFIAYTWWKTKSVTSAAVALIASAFLWAGVMNLAALRDKAAEDIKKSAPTPVSVVEPRGAESAEGGP